MYLNVAERDIMVQILTRFLDDESGATAIEYALVGALVSLAGILGLGATGNEVTNIYDAITSDMSSVASETKTGGPSTAGDSRLTN